MIVRRTVPSLAHPLSRACSRARQVAQVALAGSMLAVVAACNTGVPQERDEAVLAQGCNGFTDTLSDARARTIEASSAVRCQRDDECVLVTPRIGCDVGDVVEGCPLALHSALVTTFNGDLANASRDACASGCTTASLGVCAEVTAKCVEGTCKEIEGAK
ncbi:hypothetical protein EON77_15775 [bacterium]|nr:MAG: hypothetical protein EON77_15775 [bacterium]